MKIGDLVQLKLHKEGEPNRGIILGEVNPGKYRVLTTTGVIQEWAGYLIKVINETG